MSFSSAGEKGSDYGTGISGQRGRRSFRDDKTAVRAGARSHFDDPVRDRENLCVMIH